MRGRKSFYETKPRKSNPPSALLIFQNGLGSLPLVVPNGGDEAIDAQIMNWLQQKLAGRLEKKAAA